jgi:hypothetical protein
MGSVSDIVGTEVRAENELFPWVNGIVVVFVSKVTQYLLCVNKV